MKGFNLFATLGKKFPGVVVGLALASTVSGQEAFGKTHRILIENMKFVPEMIEVKAGDTVIWINRDIVPHTVTATADPGKPKAFDSGMISANGKFRFRPSKAGEFPYTCVFHPTMKATVKVSE